MNFSWEIISGIVGIIALIYTILTYNKTFFSKPTAERDQLILQFKSTQALSKNVSDRLQRFASENDLMDQDMFEGVTYRKYISLLNESQSTNLSDKLLEDSLKLDLPKLTIESMIKSLEAQYNDLLKLESSIRMLEK